MIDRAIDDRLTEVLNEPREGLDVEVKNWLNLRSDEAAKATFAKAALALANHGGGIIILGMTETADGMVPSTGRPPTLDGYGTDVLNGIIHNYADPAFHCTVHLREAASGDLFPMVSIPGGHRVPIRSKRGGPNGQIVKDNSVYVRRPGPRSETPQTAQDWDALLSRCLAHRRDEMFDQIRALVTGAVPQAPVATAPDRLIQWVDASKARWMALIEDLPAGAAERCPHGFMWFAFELIGNIQGLSLTRLSEVLRASEVDHSGWPPFWYPSRPGIAPYPFEGVVECWIGGDTEQGYPAHGSGGADFWRVSPDGLGFILRGYREDDLSGAPGLPSEPGSWSEIEWPIATTAEVALYIESLAKRLIDGPSTTRLSAGFTGMKGRRLTSITGRHLHHRTARQDEIELTSSFSVDAIGPNLPEIIGPLLLPYYNMFDFFEPPTNMVADVIKKLRQQSF